VLSVTTRWAANRSQARRERCSPSEASGPGGQSVDGQQQFNRDEVHPARSPAAVRRALRRGQRPALDHAAGLVVGDDVTRTPGHIVVGAARTAAISAMGAVSGAQRAPVQHRRVWRRAPAAWPRPRGGRSSTSLFRRCVSLGAGSDRGSDRRRAPPPVDEPQASHRDSAAAPAGPPLTSSRSSGENTENPKRTQEIRGVRVRPFAVRLHPAATVGRGLRLDQRVNDLLALPQPGRSPESAPLRANASVGAPRKLDQVARYPTASMMLVLPWPSAPSSAVRRGRRSASAELQDRQPVSQKR